MCVGYHVYIYFAPEIGTTVVVVGGGDHNDTLTNIMKGPIRVQGGAKSMSKFHVVLIEERKKKKKKGYRDLRAKLWPFLQFFFSTLEIQILHTFAL